MKSETSIEEKMGQALDKEKPPNTTIESEVGNGNGMSYAVSSMQGHRKEMQDSHCLVSSLPDHLEKWSYFSVYDGHGKKEPAQNLAENLLNYVLTYLGFSNEIISNNFDSATKTVYNEIISESIRLSYMDFDYEMKSNPNLKYGGSTAISVFISPNYLYFVNLGDSRAVLWRDGKVAFASVDHKPNCPAEKLRIEKAGGYVSKGRAHGMALSRAFGDYRLKQIPNLKQWEQIISPEPEITVLERQCELDEFLVLASDGVWDAFSNEDLCKFIQSQLLISSDLQDICSKVLNACLEKGSRDNMTIILVAFPGCPDPSKEMMIKAIKEKIELERAFRNLLSQLTLSNEFHGILVCNKKKPNLARISDAADKSDPMYLVWSEWETAKQIWAILSRILLGRFNNNVEVEFSLFADIELSENLFGDHMKCLLLNKIIGTLIDSDTAIMFHVMAAFKKQKKDAIINGSKAETYFGNPYLGQILKEVTNNFICKIKRHFPFEVEKEVISKDDRKRKASCSLEFEN